MKKNKKVILIIFFIVINTFQLRAQNIYGYIYDKASKEYLVGANVYFDNLKIGTSTNNYGFYSLKISGESQKIIISYVGYEAVEINIIQIRKDTLLSISLEQNNKLDGVIISATKRNNEINVPVKTLNNIPLIFGEKDINKSLQLLPGIISGAEGTSSLNVRGGGNDHNLVLLDGGTIYNANHLGSFLSIFNPNTISSYTLYRNYIPAEFDGRLSSVMDVKLLEGNQNKLKANLEFGMMSTNLSMESPLKKESSSFIIGARVFNYGLFSEKLRILENSILEGYKFNDINAKFNFTLSEKDRIFFSFYRSFDKSSNENPNDNSVKNENTWATDLYSFKWNHVYSNDLFSNLYLSYSNYKYAIESNDSKRQIYLPDIHIKNTFDYFYNNTHKLKFGFNFQYFKTNSVQSLNQLNAGTQNYALFIEDYIRYNKMNIKLGLRSNFLSSNGYKHLDLNPRLKFEYDLNRNISLFLAYNRFMQNTHYIKSIQMSGQIEFWMQVSEELPVSKSNHYILGYQQSFNSNRINLSIESYYKTFTNLINLNPGRSVSVFELVSDEDLIGGGAGYSYGVEFLLKYNLKKFSGWLGYNYSRSLRQFVGVNNNEYFPFDFDRPHNIDVFLNYQINNNLSIQSTWEFSSGLPFSFPTERLYLYNFPWIDFLGIHKQWEALLFQSKNNIRMEPYHKLDISLHYKKVNEKHTITYKAGVYNVYNRINPYAYYLQFNDYTEEYEIRKISMFPIMPFISISVTL